MACRLVQIIRSVAPRVRFWYFEVRASFSFLAGPELTIPPYRNLRMAACFRGRQEWGGR
jgi:hypothetical protein